MARRRKVSVAGAGTGMKAGAEGPVPARPIESVREGSHWTFGTSA